jgi:DNA replication and repair protein RecF
MVLFHPSTMGIVQDGPGERRRFLDRALFQADGVYALLYRDYLKALASRNILLKKPFSEQKAISYFDPQLADLSAKIVEKRRRFIEKLGPCFIEAFGRVSDGLLAEVTYLPKVEGDKQEILLELRRKLETDKKRGFTSTGPHADEINIEIEGRPARKFASQGQQRMAALAMKIAETNALTDLTGRIPIMLLDDVSSELDRDKNKKLFEFLDSAGGQVFITTTHLDHILIERDRADFSVKYGEISPMQRA